MKVLRHNGVAEFVRIPTRLGVIGILTNSATLRARAIAFPLALYLIACTAHADPLGADAQRGTPAAQQRARAVARGLVTEVLDEQLRQLHENGLDSLPLYRELEAMRANMDGLIETELSELVESLSIAASGDREQALAEARRHVRRTVLQLALERPGLERRLKIAELAARIRHLIAALETFLDALESRGADESAGNQLAVLRELKSLLEKAEAAQSVAEADRESTLERVRELVARQEKLRAEAAAGELTDALADVLVKRQTGIHQALVELAPRLRHAPSVVAAWEQARDAAFAAGGLLFELAAAQAIAEQDRVLANLGQIEEQLVQTAKVDKADENSLEYPQLADELSQLVTALGPMEGALAEALNGAPERHATGRLSGPATGRRRDFSREPWFDKLPAEVRRAVRAEARRPAPRGYEQRLERYFESLD